MLADLNAQRAVLGEPPWSGLLTIAALGRGCVRAVLQAMDGGQAPQRPALRTAVTHLLDLLAGRAPGRAVEVRIPPHAAIQCIAGPTHTRGTPPNVVETDAQTWILLAVGRLSWAQAAAGGKLRASGARADLSGYLPLAAADAGPGQDH